MSEQRPTVLVITGRPGSGKSTLARTVASHLRCPLLGRDEIFHGLHLTGRLEHDPMGTAFNTFFDAIAFFAERGVSVVAEAAFQGPKWEPRLAKLVKIADVRVITCEVPVDLARDRVVERETKAGRSKPDLGPNSSVVRPYETLAFAGAETISVTTSSGYEPPLDDILNFASGG